MIKWLQTLFGSNRNVVAETIEVFRENAEKGAQRDADYRMAAQAQYASEFQVQNRTKFDSFIDGLNRLPRPAFALGCLMLFVMAMVNPAWFAARMVGLTAVPEPMWWLIGGILGFYFGGRFQAKHQDFQKSVAATVASVPQIIETMEELDEYEEVKAEEPADHLGSADLEKARADDIPSEDYDDNAALMDWKPKHG